LSERFFLYVIDDGEWHGLGDVASELNLPLDRVLKAAEYLARGGFIHYDRDKGEVRIQDWVRRLPGAMWEKPCKRSTGTVIVSPGGSVKIQDTSIYNSLESGVELTFLVEDEGLKEILISRVEAEEKP
jgi:hypothetical protein